MSGIKPRISVFTKPWKTLSIAELATMVSGLGFDGIELPLRDGFQVEPADALDALPRMADTLAKYGLSIMSVAGAANETICAACNKAGVPLIRIMLHADLEKGYLNCERQWLADMQKIEELCQKYGVKVGIQHHYGSGVNNSMEMRHLLIQHKGTGIGAIWDAAHSALAGEEPEQGLDIAWEHLYLVNIKSAYYAKSADPINGLPVFRPHFTTGHDGPDTWPRIITYLKKRGYAGDICMPAEYTDEKGVNEYIARDIAYLKELLAR